MSKIPAVLKGTPTDPCCCGVPCHLECQSKAGTAELCGFEEFTEPSTPPKKYLHRAEYGTLTLDVFNNGSCAIGSDYAGGPLYSPQGDWLTWVRIDNVTVEFTGHIISAPGARVRGTTIGPDNGGAFTSTGWLTNGQTQNFDLTNFGNVMPVHCQAQTETYYDSSAPTVFAESNYRVSHLVEVWDLVQDYGPHLEDTPPTCAITETDNSTKMLNGILQGGGPSEDDFTGLLGDPTLTQTERTIDGNEVCTQTGSGPTRYSKAIGELIKTLTIEDTEDDALSRATAGEDWALCLQGCVTCISYREVRGPTDFSFAYSKVQVRANLGGLTAGHSYDVTIKLYSRVLGSRGNWVLYGTLTGTVTATGATGQTSWQDLPHEDGYEIMAGGCSAKLNT